MDRKHHSSEEEHPMKLEEEMTRLTLQQQILKLETIRLRVQLIGEQLELQKQKVDQKEMNELRQQEQQDLLRLNQQQRRQESQGNATSSRGGRSRNTQPKKVIELPSAQSQPEEEEHPMKLEEETTRLTLQQQINQLEAIRLQDQLIEEQLELQKQKVDQKEMNELRQQEQQDLLRLNQQQRRQESQVDFAQIPMAGPPQMQYRPQQAVQEQFPPVSGPSQPQGHFGCQSSDCKRQKKTLEGMVQQLATTQVELKTRERDMKMKLQTVEKELRDRVQDIVALQKDLSKATESIANYKSQLETRDWVISRDDIEETNTLLGRGGYGFVHEGWYCGCAVAVKKFHSLSPPERRLFQREMDIASRCRHPCLLQFIGATNDEADPLFVTELMEKSLRKLLHEKSNKKLSDTEISIICLDVARALNYLHQRKPTPIVHRDVSSANVLLWRRDNKWRGKLSDYGTARFVEETMTRSPGTMIYSAPEAATSSQTVKVDVYSFGVLLCEMCIQEFPVPERRNVQVALMKNQEFKYLVEQCLIEDPDLRPDMDDVIKTMGQFDHTS